MTPEERIRDQLNFVYGEPVAAHIWRKLEPRLGAFKHRNPHPAFAGGTSPDNITERDAILITYGDQVSEAGLHPLQSLGNFLETHIGEAISAVHLLPFFPYSSDDGFSIIDFRQVDAHLGDWEDISSLEENYRLMFDAVINHISRRSTWFLAYLRDEKPYTAYFITTDPGTDLSQVFRPRALPLVTPVDTTSGTRYVWTTFSDDQIDLNYASPELLLEIIDLLLFYIQRGAEIIRLDAIAFLWKEIGTSCIHLPQTHAIVKLFRAVLDAVAPGVILITETNVPHKENISYFGDPLPGTNAESPSLRGDEAQMVYQFPLAPLVLHTLQTGDARALMSWVDSLEVPFPGVTFFNFIASHDGIGVVPARGLLTPDEIQALVDRTLAHGGLVSNKTNPDGSQSVYELNITLYDALNDPAYLQPEVDVHRFIASQVIMLSLAGVPGIYIHSLFGSHNCHICVERTGRSRSINREKFERGALEALIADPATSQAQVFTGMLHLLRTRRTHPAFHPLAQQVVLTLDEGVFALMRGAPGQGEVVLCLVNITTGEKELKIKLESWGLASLTQWHDLIGGMDYSPVNGELTLTLKGYQSMWLASQAM
jgi:sucrose phosphorylase